MTATRWPQQTIAALLIVAAGMFVIGVTSENDNSHSDELTSEAAEHNQATESHQAIENEAGERSTSEAEHAEEDEERVLGIDVESPLLVTAAVIVSLLLAGLVWRRPHRQLLIVIAIVAAGFAVLDAAEIAHQLDEDRSGLALLAGVIMALHTAAAALAIREITRTTATHEPATS
jgi:Flp pilus assembly protein TadB